MLDEARPLDERLLAAFALLDDFLRHADTCPCTHCAHLRLNSVSDQHGAGASGSAPGTSGSAPTSGEPT